MKKIIVLLAAIMMMCALNVSAHDIEYGYTHNHFDYVVVADVDNFDEETADLTVVDYIISSESCGDNDGNHIPPEKMTVELDENDYSTLKLGSMYVVAVIDNTDGLYETVMMYEANSDDYKTLLLTNPHTIESAGGEMIMSPESAAFNDFINSGGKYCNHFYEGIWNGQGQYIGDKVTRTYGSTKTVIYTSEDGYIQNAVMEEIPVPQPPQKDRTAVWVICSLTGIIILMIIIYFIIKKKKIKGDET